VEEGEVRVVGGHLIEGCRVHGFAEIAVLEVEGVEMERGFDELTKRLQLFA
jgi:predicted DNA-binding protein with PD1-like motif